MDALDSQPHPETLKGKAEVERGMAKLTGGRGADAAWCGGGGRAAGGGPVEGGEEEEVGDVGAGG